MRHQSRVHALQALYQAELLKSKDSKELDELLEQLTAPDEIKEYTRSLVVGTLAHQKEIEAILTKNITNWKVRRLSVLVRNLLFLAIYEMYFEPTISHRIIMNEAMELAKEFIDEKARGFVNSVLQNVYDSSIAAKKAEHSEEESE